jgi:hypothetical protein
MLLEIRAVIHFLWLKKFPNPEISHKIDSVYESVIIWFRTIQKWTHRFEGGEHSLEDEPRPGHPRSAQYVDAIRVLLVNDTYISQNLIACILIIQQSTVKHVLHKDFSL